MPADPLADSTAADDAARLARDIVRRALASLRERNVLPSVDLPPVTLAPLEARRGYSTPIANEIARAAEAANLEHATAEALAAALASYLDETVNLVPAYSQYVGVAAVGAGMIELYLRDK